MFLIFQLLLSENQQSGPLEFEIIRVNCTIKLRKKKENALSSAILVSKS